MGGTLLVPATTISPSSHPPPVSPFINLCGRHSSPAAAVQSPRSGFISTNDEAHRNSRWNSSMYCWDRFYHRHQNKFFKDRHYLEKDWGHYFSVDDEDDAAGKVVFEVGCGTGNAIFPLVTKYPKLFVHACDFSPHAITLIKSHTKFCEDTINAFVCNVAEENVCEYIMPSSVDIVTLIFMLSAVSPEKMPFIIQNLKEVLKPKGFILLRDYATGDFAQVKLQQRNQMISENYFFRGDGTSAFYFSEDYLSTLFLGAGFKVVDMNTYCKEIENRSRNIIMPRRWIRAAFSQH